MVAMMGFTYTRNPACTKEVPAGPAKGDLVTFAGSQQMYRVATTPGPGDRLARLVPATKRSEEYKPKKMDASAFASLVRFVERPQDM
jgi:hypothetical protein